MGNRFQGRSLAVINDLSMSERMYLFEKTRMLKQHLASGDRNEIDRFRIDDPDFGIYEVFLEASTRTRESFKNAAEFHNVKFSSLDVGNSSINKKESYADTFNTLTGYDNSVFIVRSTLEGVCRWLEANGKDYSDRNGIKVSPSFINAGDGKHEHPTQELLDEYTFLEHNAWNNESIHIALIGDLYHGRTVHSKAQGLKIFRKVKVDLVAPKELALPEEYLVQMRANGYEINSYDSIEEYLEKQETADIWYFTRLQLERMGDDVLKRADILREKVSFQERFLGQVRENTVFYHPLPRSKEHPVIPVFLDSTPLNGWEEQSVNGKLVRIILLGLVAGRLGDDFSEAEEGDKAETGSPVVEVPAAHGSGEVKKYAEGVNPIPEGIVIDHICRNDSPREIREHIGRIINVMELFGKGGEWISSSNNDPGVMKGIIFRPGEDSFTDQKIEKLGAIAPGATLNIISSRKVVKKYRLKMPEKVYGVASTGCSNSACISHDSNGENVPPSFLRLTDNSLKCAYCEKIHSFKEIWK